MRRNLNIQPIAVTRRILCLLTLAQAPNTSLSVYARCMAHIRTLRTAQRYQFTNVAATRRQAN